MLLCRCAGDVAAGLVAKALTARARTQQHAQKIVYELVSLEAGDAVVEELLKGLAAKAPKAVAAAVQLMADIVRYGFP